MNNKFIKSLLLIVICFLISPSLVSAIAIKSSLKWTQTTANSGLGFSNQNYYTKGYWDNPRQTRYISGWRIVNTDGTSGDRVFCVEPGITFPSSSTIGGYERGESDKAPTHNAGYNWDVSGDVNELNKIFSCWSETTNSIVATQALTWELVTEERTKIDETKILKGNYKPYQSDGKIYGDGSGITSLYELIDDHSGVFNAYKSVLKCAARFNIRPSFASASDLNAAGYGSLKQLTSYSDSTKTFSLKLNHSSTYEPNLLKYYTVKSSDSNVKVSKTDTALSISTTKEIPKTSPVKITLTYTYKDDGTQLNTHHTYYYLKSGYQTLARGSTTRSYTFSVWTGDKPTYQLKVKKVDSNNKAIKGVKFDVFSDAACTKKIGTTDSSDENGEAKLTGISSIGTYYVKENSTPDGYVTNTDIMNIAVKAENKTGTTSYGTSGKNFINKSMNFELSKKTIDSNGNVIDISDYSSANCTGNYTGPVFVLKKDNKQINVEQTSAGKYVLGGTSSEIKTCNGKFNIEGISSGEYVVTETSAPDGMQLPSNPSKNITVKKGEESTVAVMYNGVTGVVFTKTDEDGNLIDGGKYSLQRRIDGVYKDIVLKHDEGAVYSYSSGLTETNGGTIELDTTNGTINVKSLEPGEYRFTEKQAPDGYQKIEDKDSTAKFTISDKATSSDYYMVNLVNQKVKAIGSYDSAELIVTIITGRKVANYLLIISGLAVLLVLFIVLRKRMKK